MSVSGAMAGSYRASLEALRDRLAAEIDERADSRSLAPLAKQLSDVLTKIEQLPDASESSSVDEIARKREKRRKKAAGE